MRKNAYVCQYPRQVIILYIVNTRKGCNHGWHFFHFYIKKMRYTKIWKINYQRQISFRQIGEKKKINPVRYSAGLHDPIFICTFTTVKPLYSGHHWDLKIVSVIERFLYIEVLPKLAYFTSKTYSRVLGYSVIETAVCQKVFVGRRNPKDNILEDIMLIW